MGAHGLEKPYIRLGLEHRQLKELNENLGYHILHLPKTYISSDLQSLTEKLH